MPAKQLLPAAASEPGKEGRLVESSAIQLEILSKAVRPLRTVNAAPVEVRDLAYDVSQVTPGALFACVRGLKSDGHAFAAEAVEQGAVALLVADRVDLAVPQLVVDDVREAMALAADAFFGYPTRELSVAGVTGTNGKTTTSFLLYAMLAAAGRRPGLLGTIECRIGGERRAVTRTTPEAIDLQRTFREMLDAGDRSCAMEASSHGADLGRLVGVRFAVLVFTNLTQDHLDYHGTIEEYFQAKRRLFVDPGSGGLGAAAVNVGDEYGRRLARELEDSDRRLLTFGLSPDAEITAEDLEVTGRGFRFRVADLMIESRLRGHFNVENVLGAIAAGRLLDIPSECIQTGIRHVTGIPGRFEAVDEDQPFAVLVDYAHTPEALENVLREARAITRGRLICVFGCGGDRDRGKRPQMGEIASRLADAVVVTSDNPRTENPDDIIAEILSGIDREVEVDSDRTSAIERAVQLAEDGDAVVIAGKGHEQGQEFANHVVPFDDRDVARDALRKRTAGATA